MRIMTKDEYDQWMAEHIAYAKQYMKEHDRLPINKRMKEYGYNGIKHDFTWNRNNQQARRPRYTVSPVQLRRIGIVR